MAHSIEEFGGERVESFIMSVIETVSKRNHNNSGWKRTSSVSPYPISPASSSPTGKSQSSQELVEDTLGSLATLVSVSSSSTFIQGGDGAIKVVARSSEKLHRRRKGENPRRNILHRKKSSLKALSPEDLGRVSKSPSQLDALSPLPPSVVVTHPSSSTAPSPTEKYFNDKGEKITVSSPKYDHPSTFHLRKPISSYSNTSGNSNRKIDNSGNKEPKSEIKISSDRTNNSGNTFKKITSKKLVGQRSANCTGSKDNPEPSQLLHNNCNASNVGVSSTDDKLRQINSESKVQNSRNNADKILVTANQEMDKNSDVDDKRRQQELDNHDNSTHGQTCVHHHHHHSHHHHYHYYETSGQQKFIRGQSRRPHQHHPSFSTNNNNQHVNDSNSPHDDQQQQNDMYGKNINSSAALIPQQPQQHQQYYLHNHHTMMMIKSDMYSSSPAEHPPKSPPPSHDEYHLDDISFYRKFSATSPPPTFSQRRSKSSLEWTATETGLNELISTKGGVLCSTAKRQKSRSTPIRLDSLGTEDNKIVPPLDPSLHDPSHPPDGQALHEYGCKCGGCYFCCNVLSCNCCCDECCCARQFSHVSDSLDNPEDADAVDNNEPVLIDNMGTLQQEPASDKREATSGLLKRISRSMDSLLSAGNNNESVDSDEAINDPDLFIDDHILRHLELFDTDVEDDNDDEENEGQQHEPTLSTNHGHGNPGDRKSSDTGQVQLISIIDRQHTTASRNGQQKDTHGDDGKQKRSASLFVVGNTSSSIEDSTAKLIPRRRNTSIVLLRKAPARSPLFPSSEAMRSASGDDKGGSRRRRSTNMLRTANGEIRPSPILSLPVHNLTCNAVPGNSNGTSSGSIFVLEEETRRSAVMTVTMDSMSLFLDAVHLQMNQG